MIKLEPIHEHNFYQVINLKVHKNQEKYVASNMKSLAECYLYRNNHDVFPYAVLVEEIVVGFLLTYTSGRTLTIWRMMIDKDYQGSGYGKQVLEAVLDYARKDGLFDRLCVSCKPDNKLAYALYTEFGFKKSGINEYNETVLEFHVDGET